MTEVTEILTRLQLGDAKASSELLPLVYEELRKLAVVRLGKEKPGQTLQATALVHEAYLRLVGDGRSDSWHGRGHFFAAAAEAMRRILIEQARRKQRVRHGGEFNRIQIDEEAVPMDSDDPDGNLLALNDALERLELADAARAEIVKLRYFAGLTTSQAAQAMGISISTAERYWRFAKAWLLAEISGPSPDPEKK